MVNLRTNEIIWMREEFDRTQEAYPYSTYLNNEGELIKKTLESLYKKAAFKMALDLSS